MARTIAINLLADDNMGRAFRDAAGDVDKLKDVFSKTELTAGSLSKELGALDRQERQNARSTAIVESTFKRLARAQEEAKDAAGRLERGEIDAAEAAKIQEKAEKELNRVLAAQSIAAAKAAHEADNLAEEQRQAARAAEISAAKMRLAQLKAVGAVKEHNNLVLDLQRRFPDLGKEGASAFKLMTTQAERSTLAMKGLSGTGIAGVSIALGALPWLASAAGSAITLGVGGALIGVGVVGAAQSEKVKKAWTDLRKHVVAETKDMSKPFQDTLIKTAGFFRETFDGLAPTLKESFAKLAPEATAFAHSLAKSLLKFKPAIKDVTAAMGPLLGALGDSLPELMGRLSSAISRIAKSADPKQLKLFIDALGVLITYAGHFIEVGTKLVDVFLKFGPIAIAARNLDNLGRALHNVTSSAGIGAKALDGFKDSVTGFQAGSSLAAGAIGNFGGQATTATGFIVNMSESLKLASQTAEQLRASLDALSGKTLTLRESTAAYEAAIDAASASLKENGKAHGFATEKGRANEEALNSLATAAQNQAVAMRDSGSSAKEVSQFMEGARQKFIATALKMNYERSEAIKLADKLFGVTAAAKTIPKSAYTDVKITNTKSVLALITKLRNQYGSLPRQVVTDIITRHIDTGTVVTGNGRQHHAKGGFITGPGTGTSDSIPSMLSNGEFVINSAATSKWRPLLEAINSGKKDASSLVKSPRLMPSGSKSAPGPTAPTVIEIRSDGTKLGDLLVEVLRKSIRTRGGNVQTVLGR